MQISVYDIKDPQRRSLSDTATDAILSCWAVRGTMRPTRQTKTPYEIISSTKYGPDCKYVYKVIECKCKGVLASFSGILL